MTEAPALADRAFLTETLRTFAPEAPPVPLLRQARVLARARSRSATGGFLLYGQGRTGSTLLGSLLSSHPQVEFGNEVLNGRVRRSHAYVNGLRQLHAPARYGIHVKPQHLSVSQRVASRAQWLRRAADDGWYIVHLTRADVLRTVLSNMSRTANGVSHFRAGDGRTTHRVHVDVDTLLHFMRVRALLALQEQEDLEGLPVSGVSYETDLLPGPDAWQCTTGRLFAGLGLAPHPVSTDLRRINQGSLRDLVANYEQVVTAVHNSPWAHLWVRESTAE